MQTITTSYADSVMTIVVTPELGEATTYTVRFITDLSNDTELEKITVEGVDIAFDPAQKEYTVTFNIPEGYEVPAVYALNELGKFDEIESTVDKENGTITVNTIYAGEFILYDNYRPDYLLGDVNDDGKVNMFDYMMIKSIYLSKYTPSDSEFVRADINSDGKVCDGVGMQGHLDVYFPEDKSVFGKAAQKFVDAGFEVFVTELDIAIKEPRATSEEDQAEKYADILTDLVKINRNSGKIKSIVFWGMSDIDSWLKQYDPLLFSSPGVPKNAYFKVLQAYTEMK